MPDFSYEDHYIQQGYSMIAGVDEVGRGPWAGPVVTCAAIIDRTIFPKDLQQELDDSKKISDKKRALLEPEIKKYTQYSYGIATVEEIDALNILQATMVAMQRAVAGLKVQVDFILVDGNRCPEFSCPAQSIIKGDSYSLSISAASILAKEERDRYMKALSVEFPQYGWESNAGYGTKKHQQGLAEAGITPHHRKSFKPIKKMMGGVD